MKHVRSEGGDLPLVSILIPVYNRRILVSACIQSALDQTYPNIEVVVVDNASDDGTWEVCRGFASDDERVRVFRNESNVGPVGNWRRCAQEARGEFSKIVFSDDLLLPDCIEKMVSAFSDEGTGFVYSPAYIGGTIESAAVHYGLSGRGRLTDRDFILRVLSGAAPVSPGAVLYRTHDLRVALCIPIRSSIPRRYDGHGAGPDVTIALATASKYPHVICLAAPVVFFRSHPGSLSVRNENNEIAESYVSAISYFLKQQPSWSLWVGYVGGKWMHVMRARKRWLNPFEYFRMHEGRGTLGEVACGVLLALYRKASAGLKAA